MGILPLVAINFEIIRDAMWQADMDALDFKGDVLKLVGQLLANSTQKVKVTHTGVEITAQTIASHVLDEATAIICQQMGIKDLNGLKRFAYTLHTSNSQSIPPAAIDFQKIRGKMADQVMTTATFQQEVMRRVGQLLTNSTQKRKDISKPHKQTGVEITAQIITRKTLEEATATICQQMGITIDELKRGAIIMHTSNSPSSPPAAIDFQKIRGKMTDQVMTSFSFSKDVIDRVRQIISATLECRSLGKPHNLTGVEITAQTIASHVLDEATAIICQQMGTSIGQLMEYAREIHISGR